MADMVKSITESAVLVPTAQSGSEEDYHRVSNTGLSSWWAPTSKVATLIHYQTVPFKNGSVHLKGLLLAKKFPVQKCLLAYIIMQSFCKQLFIAVGIRYKPRINGNVFLIDD